MPIIPQSLQQRLPQKPQTLAEYKSSKLPVQQVSQQDTQLQTKYEEAKKLLEGASYEDYETRYAKIPEELKQYFTSPTELKSSQEYKNYQQQVQQYEQQRIEFEVIKTFLGQTLTPEVKAYLHENPKEYERLQDIANRQYGGGLQGMIKEPGGTWRDISSEAMNIEKLGFSGTKFGTSAVYPSQKTSTVYYGNKAYTVPSNVAAQAVNDPSILKNYGYTETKTTTTTPTVTKTSGSDWNILKEIQYQGEKLGTFISTGGKGEVSSPYEREAAAGRIKEYTVPSDYELVKTTSGTIYVSPEGKNYYSFEDIPFQDRISNSELSKLIKNPNSEKYDPITNTYYSVSTTGGKGTLIMRQPSIEEQKKIDIQKRKEERAEEILKKSWEETKDIITKGMYPYLPEETRTAITSWGLSTADYITEGTSKFSREVLSKLGDKELKERYIMEQNIIEFGNQLELENVALVQEGNTIDPRNIQAVEDYNRRLDEFNLKVSQYEQMQEDLDLRKSQAQTNPLFNLGGREFGMGAAEFGRSAVSGLISFIPSTISTGIGLLTNTGKTFEETITGIIKLPGEMIKHPASTTGYITGNILGAYVTGKVITSIKTNLKNVIDFERKLIKDKGGTFSQQELAPQEEYIYDYTENVWKIKNKVTGKIRKIEVPQLKDLPEKIQLDILKKSFKQNIDDAGNVLDRVYIDESSLLKDVREARAYLKEEGLTDIQVKNLLRKLYPELVKEIPLINQEGSSIANIIPKQQQVLVESQYQTYFGGTKVGGEQLAVLTGIQNINQQELQIKKREQLTATIFIPQVIQQEKQKGIVKQEFSSSLIYKQQPQEKQKSNISYLSLSGLIQSPLQTQKNFQAFGYIQPRFKKTKVPEKKIKPEEKIPWGFKFEEEKEKKRKEQAYEGYILKDTKKGKGRWEKVTDRLATSQGALDRVAQEVDNTISARGKIVKATKMINGKKKFVEAESNTLLKSTGYYSNNQYKFRQFQQRKGVRTKIPNQIIELQKFRLDAPGEVRKIQRERVSSTRGMFGF